MISFLKNWFQKRDVASWRTAVSAVRREYTGAPLTEESAGTNPFALFDAWFAEAVEFSKYDPNAMVLSTVNNGVPSGRVVLLKGYDERGFVFYTNYDSDKSADIGQNPAVCLTFHWPEVFRQCRIQGKAERITDEESDVYFYSRPKESNFSAIASPQSKRIESRKELEERLKEVKEKYSGDAALIRPENWGGYRVIPSKIEFWQGRTSRLHDRIVFEKSGARWEKYRLAP